jgi:hypothetical protein
MQKRTRKVFGMLRGFVAYVFLTIALVCVVMLFAAALLAVGVPALLAWLMFPPDPREPLVVVCGDCAGAADTMADAVDDLAQPHAPLM